MGRWLCSIASASRDSSSSSRVKVEPVYAVFDCLFCEGKDLRKEALSKRREAMDGAGRGKTLVPSHRLAGNGLEAFRIAKRRGYEGVVAKELASPYIESRSTKWLKVKVHREDEFVIAGCEARRLAKIFWRAIARRA